MWLSPTGIEDSSNFDSDYSCICDEVKLDMFRIDLSIFLLLCLTSQSTWHIIRRVSCQPRKSAQKVSARVKKSIR